MKVILRKPSLSVWGLIFLILNALLMWWVIDEEEGWFLPSMLFLYLVGIGYAAIYRDLSVDRVVFSTDAKTVSSVSTSWFLKKRSTEYQSSDFAAVRTACVSVEGHFSNRVELVAKSKTEVLPIAYFKAVYPAGVLMGIASPPADENPKAIQLRNEIADLLKISNQGYVKDRFVDHLP